MILPPKPRFNVLLVDEATSVRCNPASSAPVNWREPVGQHVLALDAQNKKQKTQWPPDDSRWSSQQERRGQWQGKGTPVGSHGGGSAAEPQGPPPRQVSSRALGKSCRVAAITVACAGKRARTS